MPMAPMFHGNAWQFPYLAPMTGSRLILPGRNYEPEMLYELLEGERVTVTCGVPTMWIILTDWLARTGKKFSTLRLTLSSGSAPPRALVEKLERDWGVELAQAWGMTEALGGSHATMRPGSADLPFEQRIDRRMKSGRANYATRYRIVDDNGRELPQDGKAFGHLRIKAPLHPAPTSRARAAARSTRKAGSGPATSPPSTSTGTSRSPTAPRTSSSRAASGSARSRSRAWPAGIPTCCRRP